MYEWVLHIGRTHDAPATLDDLIRFDQALRIEPDVSGACTSIDTRRGRIWATFRMLAADASQAVEVGTASVDMAASIAGLPAGTITEIGVEPATQRPLAA